MINPRNLVWCTLLVACVAVPAGAADAPRHGFLERTHKDPDGNEARYQLFVPRGLGARPAYFVYPDLGHNCWDRADATEELYTWLLRQHRQPKGGG
jgi:hypothetical protein